MVATVAARGACIDRRRCAVVGGPVGGEEAFEALYRDSRDRLARQLFVVTGNRDEAAEVVQEAFARGWAQWSALRAMDDPEGWLRRVAYRLAVSRWRRSRRVRSGSDSLELEGPAGESDVGVGVEVMTALAALPIRYRQVLALRHLVGLSVEETGAELGVPVGTVKSWLHRGRQQLAAGLAADEQHDEERIG
jgi:RNA polymerase sigma-70 factor (ECF subfamily)